MDEHGKDGTRFHESGSYVGKVYVCILSAESVLSMSGIGRSTLKSRPAAK